ncbi:hypothetical protein [Pararhizobium sp. A13]|uniref:hypothetical protein n=1 Tax=Pararhizobium sp. A13 TaxID=3133975 RepID=UPI003253CDB1
MKAEKPFETIAGESLQILVPRFNSGRGLQNFPQYSQLDRVAASTMSATLFHCGHGHDVLTDQQPMTHFSMR